MDIKLEKANLIKEIERVEDVNVLRRISEDSAVQAPQSFWPDRHPPDKFKRINPGNFRAFEKMSLRIAYKIADTQIRILRIKLVK